jgi:hypothetical protein
MVINYMIDLVKTKYKIMKTQFTFPTNKALSSLGLFMTLIITCITFTPIQAQSQKSNVTNVAQNERIIKGVISDANGPLESASIILKGTNTGTTTDSKGEFTFPKPLATGDILLVSYLGYENQDVKIKENTTFLRLVLTEDLLEFVGALNTDKPYKSKRSN